MKSARALLAGLLTCLCACTGERERGLYVATDGDDRNPGTRARPLKTLEGARDALRAARRAGARQEAVRVTLRGGEYAVGETLTFGADDGGAPGQEVVYRAAAGERVSLVGAAVVPASAFRACTERERAICLSPEARRHLVALELRPLGIKHAQRWGDVVEDGKLALLELYADGQRMPLARYPNEGFLHMKRVVEVGSKGGAPGRFAYEDVRHERWTNAVARGLWFKGFWRVPWQSEYVRVQALDTARREVTQAAAVSGGIGSKYHRPHGSGQEPYLAVNLLEELDQPGEWCVDVSSQTLFFWPPADLASSRILLADRAEPLVRFDGASHVALEGVCLEGRLGNAVEIGGGEAVRVARCEISNVGRDGVVVRGGRRHRVAGCVIHDVGAQGVYADGGVRATLEPAGHLIENNHIYRFARTKRIYAGGINLGYGSSYGANPDCVGITVRHNRVHDTPHVGILYSGNNHLLEYNEVFHVALESNDMGGFYTVNDWTSRGNVLRHNFVHSSPHAEGIYCDDGDSGDTIVGNAFYGLSTGVFIGGGRDNIVSNNIAIGCARALYLDARGVSRNYTLANARMVARVTSANPARPPWSVAYPALTKLLTFHPPLPVGTAFIDNRAVNCKKTLDLSGDKKNFAYNLFERNREETAAGLDSLEAARAFLREKTQVPVDRIGLCRKAGE